MKYSISKKLVAGFSICVLLMTTLVGFDFLALQKIEKLYHEALRRSADMELATDAKHIGEDLYQIIADAVINRNMFKTEESWATCKRENLSKLQKVALVADTPMEHAKVAEAMKALDDIASIFEKEMLSLIRKEAEVSGPLADMDEKIDRRVAVIEVALQQVAKSMSDENQQATREFHAVLANIIRFGLAISLIGLVVALSISTLTIRRIVRSLSELTRAALEMEKGNYLVSLQCQSDDEIGVLSNAFRSMSKQVEKRTLELRASNEYLQHEISERKLAEEQLQKAHNELDMKVKERTAELSLANEMLWQEISMHRKTAEEARKSEARLNEAQRIAHIGNWELDLTHNRLLWSDELYRIFEIDPKIFRASYEAFLDTVHPEDKAMVDETYRDSVKNKKPYDIVHRLLMPDKRIKFVHERCETLYDQDDMPVRSIGTTQDITERKQAEKEMGVLQEQFRQSQKMEAIGQLAGGIAHDFNNLLTIIKGYGEITSMELKEADPLREYIGQIQSAADRATALTRQILAFSRRQIMEMKVLDLNMVLKDLDKMLRRVIGEDIELVSFLKADCGRVKADPGQIEQVIMNLAVNARDAMPGGGKLTIETDNVELDENYARGHLGVEPGRYVMLSVSDTGCGMEPEIKDRIFEPFFTTKEKGRGTGLGLSTVYGIVKQSGGNIGVYSESGQGTTFKIYLGRVDEPLAELGGKTKGKGMPRGNETIVIVEDDEGVRKLAVRILAKQEYTVLEAPKAEEALEICKRRKEPVHLVLTDVVMPEMSGRQLIEALMQVRKDFKVLYMSGYTDNAIVHHGVLEGEAEFIQKPFSFEGLATKVREVLDK